MNLVGYWKYHDVVNEDCTICHCSIYDNSINYQDIGKKSYIAIGVCNHAFHNECIIPWLKVNSRCPICFSIWKKK
jgi:hypothetical protein